MRIKVIKIIEDTNEIVFETLFGVGRGHWMTKTSPKLNAYHEVEFEIPDSLVWEENVFLAKNNKELIEIDNKYLNIQGNIEQIDSDGLVVFRIGSSIILIDEFKDVPPVNSFIQVKISNLRIFDTNI